MNVYLLSSIVVLIDFYNTYVLVLQTLCTECGQKLSDAELKMVKQEPVAKKMDILKQQYEGLQVCFFSYFKISLI